MEQILVRINGIFLTLYIMSIVVFKQNYNTYTYYIDILFFSTFLLFMLLKKDNVLKVNTLIYAYALFIIFCLLGLLYGVDFGKSSLRTLQLFLILVNMFFIYNVLKKLHLYNSFLNGILLASLINYLLIFEIIHVPFEIIFPGGGHRIMGTTGNPNVLAIIMLISILTSIIYIKRNVRKVFLYYQYLNILFASYTIVATVSKKGIIFGFILLMAYTYTLLKNPKKFFKMIVGLIILSLLLMQFIDMSMITAMVEANIHRFTAFETQLNSNIASSDGSTSERAYMIKTAWNVFQNSPLIGYGITTFSHFNRYGTYAHNNYLELLSSIGIIGTVLFYSMYYFVMKTIIKMKNVDLKIIFLLFILILLFMDIAVVSYSNKYLLYILVFFTAYAEDNNMEKSIKGEFK